MTPANRFLTPTPDARELRALAAAVVKSARPARSSYRPRYQAPAAATPAAPAERAPKAPHGWTIRPSALWAAGAALLCAIVAAISVGHRTPTPPASLPVATASLPVATAPSSTAAAAPDPAPDPDPSAELQENPPEVKIPTEERAPPPVAKPRRARPTAAPAPTEEAETPPVAPPVAAEAADEKPLKHLVSTAGNEQLDDLVKIALEGTETRGDERAAEEALPPLTRDEIKAAMKEIRPRIKDCYRQFGKKGMARVRVEVGDGGEVASTTVEGTFANTPTSACVESAVKEVRFPASAGMTFRYPFPVR